MLLFKKGRRLLKRKTHISVEPPREPESLGQSIGPKGKPQSHWTGKWAHLEFGDLVGEVAVLGQDAQDGHGVALLRRLLRRQQAQQNGPPGGGRAGRKARDTSSATDGDKPRRRTTDKILCRGCKSSVPPDRSNAAPTYTSVDSVVGYGVRHRPPPPIPSAGQPWG